MRHDGGRTNDADSCKVGACAPGERAVNADTPEEHGSPVVRAVFFCAGLLALGLGIAGMFLPVLPTTPFVLVAAACFARSHRRFHEWLLAHRVFGPMIDEWRRNRSIPYRTKITAIATMLVTLGVSVVFFVRPPWLKVVLGAFAIALATWMYRIPSRDR